ncbi:MAG: alanine/glycine:cation symporter family protein [Alphaproteobacteria bacterium]
MELFWEINSTVNSWVWGWPMVILLAFTGVFLTVGLAFMPWRELSNALKITFGKDSDKTSSKNGIAPRKALFTALSATVGTGNIAGVATAIYVGGPGALFYMWVIAAFGMATKYAEAVLAVEYREKNENGDWVGGPMYYIRKGVDDMIPGLGKVLGVAFAFFGAFTAFGIGNGVQVNSIAGAMDSTFGVSGTTTGIIVALLAGAVILGGIRRISEVAGKLVPTMIVLYLVTGTIVLVTFADNIPAAFGMIFKGAFGLDAAAGGAVGTAILMGFKRGIFSNEAGLGSAAIAHAAADTNNPVRQGMIGMVGVFIDTIVVCTFTGLIILVSGIYAPGNGVNGAALTAQSFAAAFSGGDAIVSIALALFAFTTILGWGYYGEKCFEYLTKNSAAVNLYRLAYVVFIFFAATFTLDQVWSLADTLNGLMAVPNLIGLLVLSPVLFKLTKKLKSKV